MGNPIDACRQQAVVLLTKCERSADYIDHLLETSTSIVSLISKDRALLLHIVYGVLRQKTYLDLILKHYIRKGYESFPANLKNILRSAVYQIAFLDKVPEYAAVSTAVTLTKKNVGRDKAPLVNGVLRNYTRTRFTPPKPEANSTIAEIAAYYSHPEWLVERFARQFDRDETLALLASNNATPEITVRRFDVTNEIRETQELREVEHAPDFYCLSSSLDSLSGWNEGRFIVQDPSAGLATALAGLKPGEHALDLCAAPGGKTVALAKSVTESGEVIACDVSPKRVQKLRENIERMQLKNVSVVVNDARKIACDSVDAVLVDAPCSGFGVLAKRADLRWKRKPEDFQNLINLQREILDHAAKLVKSGGRLVYATCSIDAEENDGNVEYFLTNHPEFVLEKAGDFVDSTFVTEEGFVKTFPHKNPDFDGSFAARFKKM